MHVDLDERKVVPMPDHIQAKAAGLFAVHKDLPRPEQVYPHKTVRK